MLTESNSDLINYSPVQLTGRGTIPPPIKGWKLQFTCDTDGLTREYITDEKLLYWQDDIFGFPQLNPRFDSVLTWMLKPILNSGIWISGEYPLPEVQEGTLLILSYWHDGPYYCVAEVIDNKWCIVGTETLELKEWGQFNNWMWVSVPS